MSLLHKTKPSSHSDCQQVDQAGIRVKELMLIRGGLMDEMVSRQAVTTIHEKSAEVEVPEYVLLKWKDRTAQQVANE